MRSAQPRLPTALADHDKALTIYEKLTADKTTVNEQILARQAETARVLGDRKKTAEALLRIYYEFPLTDAAVAAAAELEPLRDIIQRQGYKLDLGRATQLYGARRYSDARAAFVAVQAEAGGDDRELADLRIAESDYFLQRYAAALDGASALARSRSAPGRSALLLPERACAGSDKDDEFLAQTQALVPRLSRQHVVRGSAQQSRHLLHRQERRRAGGRSVFDQLFEKFPNGQRAERAAWKSGWWAYKNGEYAETVRVFENAAAAFPRSDYRPPFLYWAARSHGKLGAGAAAESRLRLIVTDYGNSYYGRLAQRHLSRSAQTALTDDALPAARQSTPRSPCRCRQRGRHPPSARERAL